MTHAVHETLMALLNSNWTAVATTQQWSDAVAAQEALLKSDFATSVIQGAERA